MENLTKASRQKSLFREDQLEIFMQAPLPICLLEGPQYRFTLANPPYEAFVRRKPMGKTVREVFTREEVGHLLPLLDKAYYQGIPQVHNEMHIDLPDELGVIQRYWINFGYHPLRDLEGEIRGIFVIFQDITQQVVARHKIESTARDLATEKQKLEEIFANAPFGIAIMRAPDFVFEKVNTIWNEMASPREYIGRRFDEVYPELRQTNLLKEIETVFRTGIPFIAKEYSVKSLIKDDSHEQRYFDFSYTRLLDGGGEPYGVFCCCVDCSESVHNRLRIEEREKLVRYAKEQLDISIKSAQMGAWNFDFKAHQGKLSAEAAEILDLPSKTIRSIRATIRKIHPDDRSRALLAWREAMLEHANYQCEFRIVRSDGGIHWVFARGTTQLDAEGSALSFSGMVADITERQETAQKLKEAKELAEFANATKTQFLANMSHEIRTPLSAIVGFADLLRRRDLAPEVRLQYLDTIVRNGKALTRIIDDILDITKVESGKLDIEAIEFSFLDLINEVFNLFRERAKAKNIFLRLNIGNHLPARILSDPTRLRQILINIVGNAIKFTHKGGITLSIEALSLGEKRFSFTLKVDDTGIGIPKENQGNLFQPFVQGDNTTTRKYGGTGLGLVLSQRLARALGGDIRYVPRPDKLGSSFEITFIAREASRKAAAKKRNRARKLKHDFDMRQALKDVRILVAEDSPDNQFIIREILLQSGAHVETVTNGEEAYSIALKGPCDIVLMDLQMPVMDGYEATRSLREAGFDKPVIALTAHAMAEDRLRTVAAGCNGHLTKPIDAQLLVQTLVNLL